MHAPRTVASRRGDVRTRALEYEKATKAQIVLWLLIAYLLYIGVCVLMETYSRKRFDVQRDSAIARITDKRAHLLAVAHKSSALSEIEEWPPYKAYMYGSVAIWGMLAIWTGVVVFRVMLRQGAVRTTNVRLLAIGLFLPACAVFLSGILVPLLVQKAWEQYTWLSW